MWPVDKTARSGTVHYINNTHTGCTWVGVRVSVRVRVRVRVKDKVRARGRGRGRVEVRFSPHLGAAPRASERAVLLRRKIYYRG